MVFKVDDTVKRLHWDAFSGFKKGEVAKITEINEDESLFSGWVKVDRDMAPSMWMDPQYLEVVETAPPVEIQVGDTVRCIAPYDYEDQFTRGNLYVVSFIDIRSYSVERDNRGEPNGWSKEFFEFVSRPTPVVGPEGQEIEVKTWIVYVQGVKKPLVQHSYVDQVEAEKTVNAIKAAGRKVYATKVITTKIKA